MELTEAAAQAEPPMVPSETTAPGPNPEKVDLAEVTAWQVTRDVAAMIQSGGSRVDDVFYDVEIGDGNNLVLVARIGDTDSHWVPTRLFKLTVREIR
ncbi:hypothetical protein ACQPXM_41340 (plasmid) [Kribbella sp. CA-253562]|uniref:hypothetical protein n=1 Tax=Kribbella sp. CA-253562 TaxID=3239942 RepID=UPI003D8F84DF